MPTTIYDSSLLTQRRKIKAETGDFMNRIQNTTTPNSGYGQRLGIYDQSQITNMSTGRMKYFRKDVGCTNVSNGCPCKPLSNGDAGCCGTN